jgi:HEAT repeat protein
MPKLGDSLRRLWGAGLQKDESAFLLPVLREPGNLPEDAIDWVVTRLGELKNRRAVAALAQAAEKRSYPVVKSAQTALIQIGGAEVESAAKGLLAKPGPEQAREAALTILYELKGAGSLPYLRQALSDRDLRTPALLMLYQVGTVEDLRVLLPMSDFWTGDREFHYWLMYAVAGIRGRNPSIL